MCVHHLRNNSLSEADFERGDGARLGPVEPLPAFRVHPLLYLHSKHTKLYNFSTADALHFDAPRIKTPVIYYYRKTHPLLHELQVADAVAKDGAHLLVVPASVLQDPKPPQQQPVS